jgi:DNA-binding response OmpR family regulator
MRGAVKLGRLVAILDDEPDLVELVSVHLKKANYDPIGFTDSASFLKFLGRRIPDLVVLDLMLPEVDGIEICKQMKGDDRLSSVPVIILSARSEEADRILGLELGADDYVTKPFSPRELVARVKAVLRRDKHRTGPRPITVGGLLLIDPQRHEARVQGRTVGLTTTEFRILLLLGSRAGRVFSRDEILDYLWGMEKAVLDRTVDVHIRHLRKKLGRASGMLRNVRGVGYKIEE